MNKCGWLGGVVATIAASSALAATVVEGVAVKPNPVVLAEGSAPARVEIAVTVSRGQSDRQSCDVLVEAGDGSAPEQLRFSRGDELKSVRHTYEKPGSYMVRAVAGYGCSGTRAVSVAVYGASSPAPAALASTVAAPTATAPGGCPAGWWVVPESVQGARYSCRPNLPSVPLRCAAGTSYFAENGLIGCR